MSANVVTLDGYILFTLLTVASIGSMYLAGRIAERRGRSFKIWAWMQEKPAGQAKARA
jgi:hypothetical protein